MRLFFAGILVLIFALPAAADYVGWSDTGYVHKSKRSCCESAILKAKDDSVRRCRLAGGYPDYRFRSSSARGKCKWDRKPGPYGGYLYSCKGTATANCK